MPRFASLALLPILLTILPGCLWPEQVESSNWMRQFKSQAVPPDHALIEVAMIQRPLGDAYINQKIWEHADELITADQRGILDDNGFRIGQLVSGPPRELQRLLLSPDTNSRGHIFPTGKPRPIFFPLTEPKLAYELVQDGDRSEMTLNEARFCFDVVARFDNTGQTILTFTPKVEHGGAVLPFEPNAARATFELRIEKASKKHPELTFEATLGPNQYLFIGGRLERERTLGQAVFTKTDGAKEIQWLMMIRNCRPVTAAEAHSGNADDLLTNDRTMPLALQATLPALRRSK